MLEPSSPPPPRIGSLSPTAAATSPTAANSEVMESFGLTARWAADYSATRLWMQLIAMTVGAVAVAAAVLSIPLAAPLPGGTYTNFGDAVRANWVYIIVVEPLMVVLGFAFAFENRVALYLRLRMFDVGDGSGADSSEEDRASDDLLFVRRASYRRLPPETEIAVTNQLVQTPPSPQPLSHPSPLTGSMPLTGADVQRLASGTDGRAPPLPPIRLVVPASPVLAASSDQPSPQPTPTASAAAPTVIASATATAITITPVNGSSTSAASPSPPLTDLQFGPLWRFRFIFWCSSLAVVIAVAIIHIGLVGGFNRFSSLVEYATIAVISVVFHRIYFRRYPFIMQTQALVATAQTGLVSLFLLPTIILMLYAYQTATSSLVQDLLIIALGGFEFLLRLGLGTLFRGRPLLSRKVVWPSLWGLSGSQIFGLAVRFAVVSFTSPHRSLSFVCGVHIQALTSSQSVSTFVVAFCVTFTTVILHASLFTRTGHAIKSCLEKRLGLHSHSYTEHVRRVAASFFFTVLSNAIAGFQFAVLSIILRSGPNRDYFPTLGGGDGGGGGGAAAAVVSDSEYYTSLVYALIQLATAVIEILVAGCMIERIWKVDMYRLGYYCVRDMGWVVVFSMLINPPLLVGWAIQWHSRLIM